MIRTVHGLGFRVVAKVEERGATPATPAAPATPATSAARSTPPMEQRIQFCTTSDGVRIAYATSGAGPPLVKPANWLTHLEYDWESPVWRHWLRALSRDRTLVRYDERGSGLSDWEAEDQSFDAWLRDLETVVDALGLERFPLFALSQGCGVAIAYAARHPERVSRLVLYGGFVQGALARARTPEELEEAQMLTHQLPLGWGRDNPAFRLFFAARFIPDGTPEQMRWFSDLQRATTTPEIAVRLRTTAATLDVTHLAPLVRVPTLVLHASGDAVQPFDQGRRMAALVPGARFIALESRNHILLEDEPAWSRFTDEVRRFLEDDDADAELARARAVSDRSITPAPPSPPPRSSPRPRRRSG